MNALIFDIDGTLMNSHGLGRKAFEEAINNVMGVRTDMSTVDWLGRTDREIIMQVLTELHYSRDLIESKLPRIFEDFVRLFSEYSVKHKDKFQIYPHVREFLEYVKEKPVGLLTGNVMETAHLKLKMVGIDGYFPFGIGGFGDESADRNELFPLAVKRMKKHYDVRKFDRVFVIGDSHRDIACAKNNRAVAVAVATGKMTVEELSRYAPDYVYSDFNHMREILPIL